MAHTDSADQKHPTAPESTSEFLVVANRLPVDRKENPSTGAVEWLPAPGGLVTALKPVLESRKGAWVGWPGVEADLKTGKNLITPDDMPSYDGIKLVPVNLTEEELEGYYGGFSNATLWPLYHGLIVNPEFNHAWWKNYQEVNQRFADETVHNASPDATIWVQDYQLHLAPGMIRQQMPDAKIGFFLHIPFPAPELFRQLPWRNEIIESTLGSDLIGFHTRDSAWNFFYTLRTLGYDVHEDPRIDQEVFGTVQFQGRTVKIGVFPISIDSAAVTAKAKSPQSIALSTQLRANLGSPNILLAGVDRMDYTKGILQRLEALEMLLDEGKLNPTDVSMVQVATPTRERIDNYQRTREEVEKAVSRINGKYGELGHTIVHYIHHTLPFDSLVALYSSTDIMLVTALKDGMNLVSKEYIACHYNFDGALVLSEFTGAATQLPEAYMCNPHDRRSIADAIMHAVTDSPLDHTERMKAMWAQVQEYDVNRWAETFIENLDS